MAAPERIGRYDIVAHLATGGMGQVFLARWSGIGGFVRHVVLKTLDLPGTDEDEAVAMFLDEARLLGLLHHQHITPVYEVGKDDDGQLFLVMDYVHGHTAHDVWQRTIEVGAALPIDFSLTVAAAAASGLHYAHTRRDAEGRSLRIVHRDVSLSNLMIGFDGAVKVIDFGIAKAANRSTQTQAGFIKGKLGYMAPEQLRGLDVDARTDVFALGIVLYELTTMRRAFRDESDRVTMDRIRAGTYTTPSAINPEYPPELERIVKRALRVDPRERYLDAEEMRRELDLLGHQLGLVLGDAAVVEVMSQLFEQRHEPWQRAPTLRPSMELEVSLAIERGAGQSDNTLRSPMPQLTLRAATQATESQLQTPPHGLPKRPSAFSIEPSAKRAASASTDSLTILSPGSSASTDSLTILSPGSNAALANDTEAMPAMPTAAAASAVPAAAAALEPRAMRANAAKLPEPIPLPSRAARLPTAPRGHRPIVIAGIAVAVVAVGAAVGMYLLEGDGDAPAEAKVAASGSASATGASGAAGAAPDPAAPTRPGAPPASSPSSVPPARPTPPAPPAREEAKPPLLLPPGAPLQLVIKTTPPDATVLLDGKRLGHTPYSGTIEAAAGKHSLKLRRSGYATVTLEVPLDTDLTREFTLQRAKGDPAP